MNTSVPNRGAISRLAHFPMVPFNVMPRTTRPAIWSLRYWWKREESNLRRFPIGYGLYRPVPSPLSYTLPNWYPRGELNSHVSRRQLLRLLCLHSTTRAYLNGAGNRNCTRDILVTREALCCLSYTGKLIAFFVLIQYLFQGFKRFNLGGQAGSRTLNF